MNSQTVNFENTFDLKFIEVPSGQFLMGSPENEIDKHLDEKQHLVSISSFELAIVPVTKNLYQAITKHKPSTQKPVTDISFYDAIDFCNLLSSLLKIEPAYQQKKEIINWNRNSTGFRLSTEAEWEYSCRAGTSSARYGKIGQIAWYDSNSNEEMHLVGEKKPNTWGLYDMLGNVWEWCWDWYGTYPDRKVLDPVGPDSGPSRVLRGGSCYNIPRYVRAARRNSRAPDARSFSLGFRLARTINKSTSLLFECLE